MPSVKRWIAVCLLLAVFLIPMTAMATADSVVIRITVIYKNETISQDIIFSGFLTMKEFAAIVTKAYGSWTKPSAFHDDDLLGDCYSSGHEITIKRTTVNSWPLSNAGNTYTVAPDGFNYGKKPLPTRGPQVQSAATSAPSSGSKSSGNVTWSTKYLYQVILNRQAIAFRLFGDGEKIAFTEKIENGADGQILVLATSRRYGELVPRFDAAALDFLKDLNIVSVRVISRSKQVAYTMGELEGML